MISDLKRLGGLTSLVGFLLAAPIERVALGSDLVGIIQIIPAGFQPIAPSTQEDLEREIAGCAAVLGGLERLECFDSLARGLGLAGPQVVSIEVGDTGEWAVNVDRNPVDDTERVILALTADAGSGKWGDPVTLVARCQSEKTELYINWSIYLGDDSHSVYDTWKSVLTRIGTAKAETSRWGVSTDNDATFAPGWAGDWLKRMVTADTFLAQVTPYGESPITAQFDIRGLRNALAPLTEACSWQP